MDIKSLQKEQEKLVEEFKQLSKSAAQLQNQQQAIYDRGKEIEGSLKTIDRLIAGEAEKKDKQPAAGLKKGGCSGDKDSKTR